MPVSISIVEDNDQLRGTLAKVIGRTEGFRCVSDYANAEDALANLPNVRPDVVLMDINLPGMKGYDCVRRLKAAHPEIQFLMLTVYEDSDSLFNSLRAGASGYLLKRTASARLLEAVRDVFAGGAPLSPQLARRVVQFFSKPAALDSGLARLTPAEREFLDQLAKGYAYKEIADRMTISIDTVRSYVRTVYEKLHVHSRTEAVVKYLQG
jgi:DNA-binding NarL/FixJ family response regulator